MVKITPQGVVTTVAVLGHRANAGPFGIAVDSANNLYASALDVATIRKINQTSHAITTFAPVSAFGLAVDQTGNVYGASNSVVHKIAPNGTAFADITGPFTSAWDVAVDAVGNLYVADSNIDNGAATIYKGLTSLPLNDSFAAAAVITGNTTQLTVLNANATKEPGEPNHAGNAGGHSLWWKWTAPASGPAVISTNCSSFPTLLGVYQGTSVDTLSTITSSATGSIAFTATAGATYYLAADGVDGATGTLSFALNPSGVTTWGITNFVYLPSSNPVPVAPIGFGPLTSMAVGAFHGLAVKSDGTVAAWGDNTIGQISVPSNLTGVTAVVAKNYQSLALRNDGTVVSWGSGTAAPSAGTLHNAVAIAGAVSGGGGMAITEDGTVVSWGSSLSTVPFGLAGVVGISTCDYFALVVKNDGTVTNWGNSPPLPPSLSGVVAVAAGGGDLGPLFGAALKNDGTVTTWSNGSFPQLSPSLNKNIIAIAAGASHLLALKNDGTVITWGDNTYGQNTVPFGLNGVVSIAAGEDLSLALQAETPPVFSTQPFSCTVNPGQTVTLVAAANATTYQWYQGLSGDTSQPVAGATNPWIVLPMPVQVGTYWVRANNALGTGDSHSASVALYPPPPNDDFANAITLTGSSLQTTGTSAGAGRQTGEPTISTNSTRTTGHTVWWTWTAPADGVMSVDTFGSNFDTLLGVYTGNDVTTLNTVAMNDNSGAGATSKVMFQATAGTTYQIMVDGVSGETGNIVLNLALAMAYAPSIVSQPVSLTATAGGNASLSVSSLAYPPPNFQWQRLSADGATWANLGDDGTYAGTNTATLSVTNALFALSGTQYRCVLDNGLATPLTSSSAALMVSVPYVFSTLAGTAGQPGSTDAMGPAARFNLPSAVAADAAGNVYVADTNNSVIRKIRPDGTVSTFAGTAGQTGSTDGVGPAARFNQPEGVAVDPAGDVFVADRSNFTIRKILPDGTVSTLAGTAGQFGSIDGVGAAARFGWLQNLAVDSAGNIYAADTFYNVIRKIVPDGSVSTVAGTAGQSGSTDGIGAAARFNQPQGVAVDAAGNVYVADTANHTIRRIRPDGTVTTFAGAPGQSGWSDGNGAEALFFSPAEVVLDALGNIYVDDFRNSAIRKISPNGGVTTIGGNCGFTGSTDGAGNVARFFFPSGLAVDAAGNVYVADTSNHTIRKGTPIPVAPGILAQPAGESLTPGQSATFTSLADGSPFTSFQWQRLPAGSSTWVNLSDGAPYSGTATATLTVGPVNVGQSGDQFRCVATNGFPPDATSNPATLTVTPPAFAAWAAGLGLSGVSATANAVPFTDGAPNLVRYAMNLGATPAAGQLPTLTSVTENGVLYLKLQYRQRKGLTAVTLTPEWATDLLSWSAVAPADLSQLPDDNADTARFEARAAVPPSGRVFLRLHATLTP